jgi:protein phosphatase
MIESFGLTDVGRVRPLNEDDLVVRPDLGFFAVCDGLGGQNAGEVASRMTVETLAPFIERSHEDTEVTWPFGFMIDLTFDANRLVTAIGLANKRVFREADAQIEYKGMGSTVVAALVRGSALTVAWLGDSRAYLVRNGAIEQITKDHTWVNMAMAAKILSEQEAEKNPWSHVLTKSVGSQEHAVADTAERLLVQGDLVLLCSDGLTKMIKDEGIARLLSPAPATVEDAAKRLVAVANEAGGRDNTTVVLVRYRES